jgi:membrane protein DedA with SNARE-associated domain
VKLIPLAGIDIVGGLLRGAGLALAGYFLGNIGFVNPT